MQEKKCCLVDCGSISLDKLNYARRELEREIGAALDDGYRFFLSEFNQGAGILFAECVNERREEYSDIYLEVVLHPSNASKFSRDEWELLSKSNGIRGLCEVCKQTYPLSVTRELVEQSNRVIAIFNEHEQDGNLFAMDYARTMERDLRVITI